MTPSFLQQSCWTVVSWVPEADIRQVASTQVWSVLAADLLVGPPFIVIYLSSEGTQQSARFRAESTHNV
jgi:hypothetical protein